MMPTRDTESKITSLPLDVLISLMGFLRPLDLIALRQTCRYLYEANNRRIVWIKALTDVCVENDVFLPTFPIDGMTTEQLLRAATLPSRLYLVPGGRFIVLLSSRTLQLWDVDGEKKLVASHCMGQYKNSAMSVQPTKDGMGLQLAVISHFKRYILPRPHDARVSIYQIFPLEGEPTFSEIATSNEVVDEGVLTPLISGDRLVIVAKLPSVQNLLVWDFLNNLWAMGDRGKPFDEEMLVSAADIICKDMFIVSGFVLLLKLRDDDAVVFELRSLEPQGSYQNPSPIITEEMPIDSLLSQETMLHVIETLNEIPCYKMQDVMIDLISDIDVLQRYKTAAETSQQAEKPTLAFQHVRLQTFKVRPREMQYQRLEGDLVGYFLRPIGATKRVVDKKIVVADICVNGIFVLTITSAET
ncbi:hypothetical protein AGABI2DRAFT_144813 [Agaricus bisporus var. bisporus H97]|uniref:hypothetical protein n=1 Tax=Agaricus bisporus var. bisporus (strain H97 / ATCC MYA-4626 / FGSC 10389) TaxID=936046 RepID=UPI00029F58F5|nr:hypothetical protein AGABI2DRAFT_144813 [Agaricus bisporus var. bisporus H97]EKV45382.1 hypothetical protein AGABI2DRAFT_144813 [Agaricus bisporus var. bisporus H97]